MTSRQQEFAKALNCWIIEWKKRTGNLVYTDRDICERIPIDQSIYSRWIHGKQLPKVAHCILLAEFFGIDPFLVLRAAGRESVASTTSLAALCRAAEHNRAVWPNGEHIWQVLQTAQTTAFQKSKYGRLAFQVLANAALDDETRAVIIADYVDGWIADNQRDTRNRDSSQNS